MFNVILNNVHKLKLMHLALVVLNSTTNCNSTSTFLAMQYSHYYLLYHSNCLNTELKFISSLITSWVDCTGVFDQ